MTPLLDLQNPQESHTLNIESTIDADLSALSEPDKSQYIQSLEKETSAGLANKLVEATGSEVAAELEVSGSRRRDSYSSRVSIRMTATFSSENSATSAFQQTNSMDGRISLQTMLIFAANSARDKSTFAGQIPNISRADVRIGRILLRMEENSENEQQSNHDILVWTIVLFTVAVCVFGVCVFKRSQLAMRRRIAPSPGKIVSKKSRVEKCSLVDTTKHFLDPFSQTLQCSHSESDQLERGVIDQELRQHNHSMPSRQILLDTCAHRQIDAKHTTIPTLR